MHLRLGRVGLPPLSLIFTLLTSPFVYAQDTGFDFDPSLKEKWVESAVPPPDFPSDQDLLEVSLPDNATVRAFLDAKSISRGPDRIARYALVVQSTSGARSIFYEGLRCETREFKTYAIGAASGHWDLMRDPEWKPIPNIQQNAIRHYMYRHLMCDYADSARRPQEVLYQLRWRGRSAPLSPTRE